MTNPNWSPEQYLKYQNERLQPGLDLLSRIDVANPKLIVDLGCGAGNLTIKLKERFSSSKIIGIDHSPEMLEKARKLSPDIAWEQGDVTEWSPDYHSDLIFSNAVFHWIDNHPFLFPRIIRKLEPGGQFAFQMPNNFEADTHQSILQVIQNNNWSVNLRDLLRDRVVLSPSEYYEILLPEVKKVDIWQTIYYHVLEGDNPVYEWVKGSALRPIVQALQGEERLLFEEEYAKLLSLNYPKSVNGTTILPYKRLFIVGQV